MRYFFVVDYSTKIHFDGFRGVDFKDALEYALKEDPEMLGWCPEDMGVELKDKKWDFKEGQFDKYVEMIYESYISRRDEIKIFDITDPLDIQAVIN